MGKNIAKNSDVVRYSNVQAPVSVDLQALQVSCGMWRNACSGASRLVNGKTISTCY